MDWDRVIEVSTAAGTVAAGAFAAVAARSASKSARSSEDLIRLERQRDADADTRAARSVLVELQSQSAEYGDGQVLTIVQCRAINAGTTAVTKCRIRVSGGGETYGPQLFGALAPGTAWGLVIPLRGDVALARDLTASLRYVTVMGDGWVASAGGEYERDGDVAPWIDQGRAWSEKARSWPDFWRGFAVGPGPITDPWPLSEEDLMAWDASFEAL